MSINNVHYNLQMNSLSKPAATSRGPQNWSLALLCQTGCQLHPVTEYGLILHQVAFHITEAVPSAELANEHNVS